MEDLLRPFPHALPIYEAVRDAVASLGPFEVAATKTQVSFRNRTRFAWLWLPVLGLKRGPDDVYLSFDLPTRVRSPRVKEVVQPRPGRFTHHVRVGSATDVDREARGWLKAAYEAAA